MINWDLMQSAEARSQIAAQAEAEITRSGALDYLNETDWYITRKTETGEAVPDGVSQARAEARIILSKYPG